MPQSAEAEKAREKSALFLRRLRENLPGNQICSEAIARAITERLEIRQDGDVVKATIRDSMYDSFIRQANVHSEMRQLTREVWGESAEFVITSGSTAPRKRIRKGAETKAMVDPLFDFQGASPGPGTNAGSESYPGPSSDAPGSHNASTLKTVLGATAAGHPSPVSPAGASRVQRAGAHARSGQVLAQALSSVGEKKNERPPLRTRTPGETQRAAHASPLARLARPEKRTENALPPRSSEPAHVSDFSSETLPAFTPAQGQAETPPIPPAASVKSNQTILASLPNINKMSMPSPVTPPLVSADDYEQRSSGSETPERMLDPQFTFDTFVQGTTNQMASLACQNAARNPGNVSNPVFIYGSTGLGKTHLLYAVGNEIRRNHPDWHVRYVTSEDFVLDFTRAVRHNKHYEFRNKYRQVDVLLVDDIQFLEKKDSSQLEFFHTFNELYQNKKQIVITSDQYPRTIPNIEERLKSRFLQGLIATIEPPTFEDRSAIIEVKAKSFGLRLGREHIDFIATHVKTNVREITGVLNTLLMNQSIKGEPPSLETIQQLLRKDIRTQSNGVDVLSIQKAVSAHYEIKLQELMGASRKENIVTPRHVAMYLAREMLGITTTEVAAAFGRRDHTTVLNAVRRISDLMERDASTLATVKELRRKLEHNAH